MPGWHSGRTWRISIMFPAFGIGVAVGKVSWSSVATTGSTAEVDSGMRLKGACPAAAGTLNVMAVKSSQPVRT